jgi:PBSX family phage terminase large subunit
LCAKVETSCTINIIKETYNSFKTTLYDDFNRRLPDFGIVSPFADKQEVKSFRLFGNKINLLGADDASKFHGASCDYFYINEALDVSCEIFDQSEMRCRKFWWMDYNPKYTDHWIYDKVFSRSDVASIRTTFKDNPFVSEAERNKILGYEPTQHNLQQGTADEYLWNVYGLGLRSAPEGLIFQHVTWVDKFPENIERVYYGLDFGYTQSPSCLTRLGIDGDRLFGEALFYKPTPTSNELIPLLREHAKDNDIFADSADPAMISELRSAGLSVFSTNKFQGSIRHGISLLKKYRVHLVDSPAVRREQSNYRYKEINGIKLDEPIDDHNHFWDSLRMAALSNRI